MPRPRSVSDDDIRAATLTAIGKHGPARLTLARVAEEAGVSPAALVQRFGSKAALLAAVGDGGADDAAAAFDEAIERSSSALAALTGALAGFAGDIHTRIELANHMAMLQLDLTDPQLHARTVEQSRLVRRRITDLLERAVAAGELVHDTPDELTAIVYTAYNGALITWAIDGTADLHDWIRAQVDAVIRPYRAPDDGRLPRAR